MSSSAPASITTAEIDERYGRTPGRKRWGRRGAWAAAAAFVAVFTAWVVWGGLDGTTASVDAVDTAHKVIDDRSVSITFRAALPPGSSASCALQAQNQAHGIVGWKIVDVPESDVRVRSVTSVVNTTELAVTGLIYRCWLT